MGRQYYFFIVTALICLIEDTSLTEDAPHVSCTNTTCIMTLGLCSPLQSFVSSIFSHHFHEEILSYEGLKTRPFMEDFTFNFRSFRVITFCGTILFQTNFPGAITKN